MAKHEVSDARVLAQIPAARRRAERLRQRVPHATRVWFVRAAGQIILELTNGSSLGVPVALIPGVKDASDRALADVQVLPGGIGIRWPALDADVSVVALARLALGAGVLLRAAGAAGGSARSAAKARAARLNGKRGGRPRTLLTG